MNTSRGMSMALPGWLFFKNKGLFRCDDYKIPYSDASDVEELYMNGELEIEHVTGSFHPWYLHDEEF